MITITDCAADKIKKVMAIEDKLGWSLRIKAEGGGCCGPKYMVALEEKPEPDDQIVETRTIKVLIDPQSVPILEGGELDYIEGLMGGGFQIKNAKVESSCGCQ